MTRSIALLFLLGCGGDCIPKDVKNAETFDVNSAPPVDVRVVHSADELRAAIGGAHLSFPTPEYERQSRAVEPADPVKDEANAQKRLDEFIAATNFATTAIAIVHAGGARASLDGLAANGPTTTLYFSGVCSACGGGNPASAYEASERAAAARADRTQLVRVPKDARVVIKQCSTECGTCPSNVP